MVTKDKPNIYYTTGLSHLDADGMFIEILSDLRGLRNRFLHWSVNNDKFGLESRTNMLGYAPDLEKQSLRKREIQDG